MKQLVTNYRYWLCALIGGVGLIGIVAEPTATTTAQWIATMLISKGIGIATTLCAICLFKHWAKKGKIDCLTDLINE